MSIEHDVRQLLGDGGHRGQLKRAGKLFADAVELINDHQHEDEEPFVFVLVASAKHCTHYNIVDLGNPDDSIAIHRAIGALEIAKMHMFDDATGDDD